MAKRKLHYSNFETTDNPYRRITFVPLNGNYYVDGHSHTSFKTLEEAIAYRDSQ